MGLFKKKEIQSFGYKEVTYTDVRNIAISYGTFLGFPEHKIIDKLTDDTLSSLATMLTQLQEVAIQHTYLTPVYQALYKCSDVNETRDVLFDEFLNTGLAIRLPTWVINRYVSAFRDERSIQAFISLLSKCAEYGFSGLAKEITHPIDFTVNPERWKDAYIKATESFDGLGCFKHKLQSVKEVEYVLTQPSPIIQQVELLLANPDDITLSELQLLCWGVSQGNLLYILYACLLLPDNLWPDVRTLIHVTMLWFSHNSFEMDESNYMFRCYDSKNYHKLLSVRDVKYLKNCIQLTTDKELGVDMSSVFAQETNTSSSAGDYYPADFIKFAERKDMTCDELVEFLRDRCAPDAYKRAGNMEIVEQIWPIYSKVVEGV